MHDEAIRIGLDFERTFGARNEPGAPLVDHVLRAVADSMRLEGDFGGARETLHRLIRIRRERGEEAPMVWHQLANLESGLGRTKEAAALFLRAADAGDSAPTGVWEFRHACEREAARLRQGGARSARSPESLAAQLSAALLRKDSDRLGELVSSTHFGFATIGGHTHSCSPDLVLRPLFEDLKRSPRLLMFPESLEGRGKKRYMMTLGWVGGTFSVGVVFLLTEGPFGWEWTGVAPLAQTARSFILGEQIWGPKQSMPNQPLSVRIKAPWPAGMGFQAGGLGEFIELEAAEVASGVATIAAVLGGCAVGCIPAAYFYLICYGVCVGAGMPIALAAHAAAWGGVRGVFAERECGFGPGGFYYDQFGHSRGGGVEQQYAIDFTRWERFNGGIVPPTTAGGTPVLACHSGVVDTFSFGNMVARGAYNGGVGNQLYQSLASSWEEDYYGARYTAQYLHFDGPDRMMVSPRMWVHQGHVLGLMDDTGDSAWDHLHFQIHDRTLPSPFIGFGRTTRPTPMDGPTGPQSLDDGDSNRCVMSDNAVVSPRALCRVILRRRSDLDEVTLRTLEGICAIFHDDPAEPVRWVPPDRPGVGDLPERPAGSRVPDRRRP